MRLLEVLCHGSEFRYCFLCANWFIFSLQFLVNNKCVYRRTTF